MSDSRPRRVAIVGSNRIPFCRSNTAYRDLGNLDMMTATLKGLVDQYGLKGEALGEVALGAVIKHSRDWNMAREATLGSGLAPETPAYGLQRACGTSLSAAIQVGNKIALGQIEAGIAAGTDTTSDAPIVFGEKLRKVLLASARGRSLGERLKPWLGFRPSYLKPSFPGVVEPRTGLSMGQHCEIMAKEWAVSQAEQDALAYTSHQNAAAAWKDGFFSDLVMPFNGVQHDANVRPDTSLEKLAKLRPVFDRSPAGTLTAGNSTPLTDGAAAVLMASEEWARAHNLPVLAYLTFSQVAAVDFSGMRGPHREGLLMAPAYAVPRMLDAAGISLQDFDFYEIHEAFAAQVLCTLKAWESEDFCRERLGRDAALGSIDRSKLNVKGGSVAVGHPFAATGARIVGGLAKMLAEKGSGRGLISVCTAGGMGVTAILERD